MITLSYGADHPLYEAIRDTAHAAWSTDDALTDHAEAPFALVDQLVRNLGSRVTYQTDAAYPTRGVRIDSLVGAFPVFPLRQNEPSVITFFDKAGAKIAELTV